MLCKMQFPIQQDYLIVNDRDCILFNPCTHSSLHSLRTGFIFKKRKSGSCALDGRITIVKYCTRVSRTSVTKAPAGQMTVQLMTKLF